MITLRQLRYLTSVARHRHFGRAADECAVSQPALSMQVRELEREIGTELIERRPGAIALTDVGLDVAQRAAQILTATRELVDFVRHRELLSGRLALGIIPTLAPYILPRLLPRLDLRGGVPEAADTMVVVPTLISSIEGANAMVERLEVHALGNMDPRIRFALLTDFPDAGAERLPGEEEVLYAAVAGIKALNARYAPVAEDRFYLFHRARRWNGSEGVWMGWERKRGKIEEFNRLLRGATDTSFVEQIGNPEILPRIRYCITLDSDTHLPRDAARRLIGVIEHPLNRPRFDPKLRRVVEGYGVLQPRVSVTLASAAGSAAAGQWPALPRPRR